MYTREKTTGRCNLKFPDKGVEIFIPPQGKHIKLIAEMISLNELKFKEGPFIPHRVVVKFDVQIKADQSIKKYAPPIELKVFFTKNDKDTIGDKISLGYLPEKDDEEPTWIKFTESDNKLRKVEVSEAEYQNLNDDDWAGYFHVEIKEWQDPSVSIGH
jgi:hypothetical protein